MEWKCAWRFGERRSSWDGVIGVPVTAMAGWARSVLLRGDGDLPWAGSGVTDVGEQAFQARRAKVLYQEQDGTLPLPALSSTALPSSKYMYGPRRFRASRGLELPSFIPWAGLGPGVLSTHLCFTFLSL